MGRDDTALHMLCRGQHGVATRLQLEELDIDGNAIDRRLANRTLFSVHLGVFRHAAVPLSPRGALLAAVLAAGEGAVASHRSAAWLLGLWDRPPPAEITAPFPSKPLLAGARVHRTRLMPYADTRVVDGIATTGVPRTLLDLGAVLRFDSVERIAHDALIRKLTTELELVLLLDRSGRRGRNGTAALRQIVRQSIPDGRLDSELERRLLVLLLEVCDDHPQLQHVLSLHDGRSVRLDFAWPERRLAIEADGRRWHASASDARLDMKRSRAIQGLGWSHHRFGWTEVVDAPNDVKRELRALLS